MNQLQKIICVGSAFVGKTSLARRFTLNTFIHSYIPTLGVSWLTKTITLTPEQLNENLTKEIYTDPLTIRSSIWDTGGQEMFTYLRPKYYAGAFGLDELYSQRICRFRAVQQPRHGYS